MQFSLTEDRVEMSEVVSRLEEIARCTYGFVSPTARFCWKVSRDPRSISLRLRADRFSRLRFQCARYHHAPLFRNNPISSHRKKDSCGATGDAVLRNSRKKNAVNFAAGATALNNDRGLFKEDLTRASIKPKLNFRCRAFRAR